MSNVKESEEIKQFKQDLDEFIKERERDYENSKFN